LAIELGHNALRDDVRLRQAYFRLPMRMLLSLKASELPKLNIDIKFKHLSKLREKRANALAKGILVQGTDDFVPASIRTGGRSIKVKLRLKGDWTEHLEGNKWSFRVRTKKSDHIFGMRRFSIQRPEMRGYHSELLFQETLRRFNILVPRYFFVDVMLNGDNIGIMALEEHFSKELLEFNGRRENVIIRFDESLVWAAKDGGKFKGRKVGFGGAFDSYFNASIDAFQSAKIERNKFLSLQFSKAVGMLRGFISGDIVASKVFDVELLGKYLAVAEFWGSKHAIKWHNLRFYLNPITMRMEPISFDADLRARYTEDVIISQREPIIADILKDPKIYKVYFETIQMLTHEILYGQSLQKTLNTIEKSNLADLRKEFFMLESYPFGKIKSRAKFLVAMSKKGFQDKVVNELKPYSKPNEDYPTLIHAYTATDANGSFLEIINAVPYGVIVESATWVGKKNKDHIELHTEYEQLFPMHLPPTPIKSRPKAIRIYYTPVSDIAQYSIKVITSIQGGKQSHVNIAKPYYPLLAKNPVPDSTVHEQLSQHSFLEYNQEERYLYVRPGNWEVVGSVVVPAGIKFKVTAGTILKFSADEGFFANGSLNFIGTAKNPIIFEGLQTGDREGTWQGIAVLNADSPSVFKNVIVRNTIGVSRSGWQLTGGVTFYKSDVRMKNCRFQGNRGEDALNIIQSKFELEKVEILETASDGLDIDFGNGTIRDMICQGIGKVGGGDAIDISGSEVIATGGRLLNISDKALSVGERSMMTANMLSIENVSIGAASKDGSELIISDSSIRNAHFAGLMAYIKKVEFGPARVRTNNLALIDTASKAIAQKGSRIDLDGISIETKDIDVKELYKTVMKPGLK
jgi:hypothetical protein